MIPVARQPEPANFDKKVRQPGLQWLAKNGYDPNQPFPKKPGFGYTVYISPKWNKCKDELYRNYNGVCAYLAVWFGQPVANSVDHFIPKSISLAKEAYEWDNYRLASTGANSKKGNRQVLDPFTITPGTFWLEYTTGRILPNPNIKDVVLTQLAVDTIKFLDLDSTPCRKMRLIYIDDYRKGDTTADFLRQKSPFVYYELNRQRLL